MGISGVGCTLIEEDQETAVANAIHQRFCARAAVTRHFGEASVEARWHRTAVCSMWVEWTAHMGVGQRGRKELIARCSQANGVSGRRFDGNQNLLNEVGAS